jgi:hypothetical protein
MLALYLFCLGVGGVLLAASFFSDLGGHDHEIGDYSDIHGGEWSQIFSLRNLTYFLFVFGAIGSGLALTRGGRTGLLELIIAAGAGLGVSAVVGWVFNYIRRTDSSEVASDSALVGMPARVILPVKDGSVGKIELSYGGQRVELLARPFGNKDDAVADEIVNGSEVVIVEMEAGMARVARANNE